MKVFQYNFETKAISLWLQNVQTVTFTTYTLEEIHDIYTNQIVQRILFQRFKIIFTVIIDL